MDIKITQLMEALNISDDDYLIIDNGAQTMKIKFSALTSGLNDSINNLDDNKLSISGTGRTLNINGLTFSDGTNTFTITIQ